MLHHQSIFFRNLFVIAAMFVVIIPLALTLNTKLLPPIGIFYVAAHLPAASVLGAISAITRFGVGLSMFLLAYVKLIAISDHHSDALKLRATTISLMFMVTGAWTSTVALMIEYGGFWHIVSIMFGVVELAMVFYTVRIVMNTHAESIAAAHD